MIMTVPGDGNEFRTIIKITFVITMVPFLFVIIKVMDCYQDDILPMNNPEGIEQCDHCGRKLQDPTDRLRWGNLVNGMVDDDNDDPNYVFIPP